ncbi:MAG TPA: porin [Thiothrix sp.]|nr:porin [Thiothrix sp.]
MKKKLLAAMLGVTFAVPALADTTLYGNFRGSLNTGDLNGAENDVDFVNNASRLGVKGAVGSETLKGIYHLQMGVNTDGGDEDALSKRFYFAGLKGGFGKVIYGRLSTPYKMAGVKQDPFYDTSAGTHNGGSNYGYSSLNNGFTDSTFAYYSPKFAGGLSVNASVTVDDAATDDHDVGVGVEYATKKFKVGASHLKMGDTPVVAAHGGADKATRVYGDVALTDTAKVALSYEKLDIANTDTDPTFAHINGTFKASSQLKLAAGYGKVEDGAAGAGRNSSGDGFSVGAFYNVLPNTTLSAIYSSIDFEDETVNNREGLALGVVQKF